MNEVSLPRVPGILVGGIAELKSLFASLGRYRGIPREQIEEVVALVPEQIRKTPCFLDRLSGLWRYDFGEPFVGLPGEGIVLGTNMYQSVDRLYDVLACARRRLTPDQLSNYLVRLADPKKHEDLLFEFAPIVRLSDNVNTQYEASGYGEGNRTVDWIIQVPEGPPILLDVKNRTKDLLEALARLQAGERTPEEGGGPEPIHDPKLLFESLEQKFLDRSPNDMVQVAWIGTELRQEEGELKRAFASLDPRRVHVAILGDWKEDIFVLANDDSAKSHVLRTFRVHESRRFVFTRGEPDQNSR